MSEKLSDHPCDVCGKPATNWANDMVEQPHDGTPFMRFKPGKVRFGCDEHRAKSHTIEHPDPLCELRAKMQAQMDE